MNTLHTVDLQEAEVDFFGLYSMIDSKKGENNESE